MNSLHFYVSRAIPEIALWCKEQKIPDHHGATHAFTVVAHACLAVCDFKLDEWEQISVLLAAALHDVDDRKFTKSKDLNGARRILLAINFPRSELVLEMIRLVSCSKNGNTVEAGRPLWHYIPRDADRLEAIGRVGIKRAHDTTVEFAERGMAQTAFWTESTPRCQTREELERVATPERLETYHRQGGYSTSLIDHVYDKLLHIHRLSSGSPTLQKMADERHGIMVEFVLEFGRTGTIDWSKWLDA
jgi:uncharacterized protein